MISNARMYSVCPEAASRWRQLLGTVTARSGVPLRWHEHPAPAPLDELWRRSDLGAVFMCGLPYSRSNPRPRLIAAPVPAPAEFGGLAQYWSEFVVRADTRLQSIEDTFGGRIAFTVADSQSGYAAAVFFLMQYPAAQPLYREVIAPQVTPLGALSAVVEGTADVAPIDAYAYRLLQRYRGDLTGQLRVVARTRPTAIPALVASPADARTPGPEHSQGDERSLTLAFARLQDDPGAAGAMSDLLLQRFVQPQPQQYETLQVDFETSRHYWRRHPLACVVHPSFLV